jgi:hypothetical protein
LARGGTADFENKSVMVISHGTYYDNERQDETRDRMHALDGVVAFWNITIPLSPTRRICLPSYTYLDR